MNYIRRELFRRWLGWNWYFSGIFYLVMRLGLKALDVAFVRCGYKPIPIEEAEEEGGK